MLKDLWPINFDDRIKIAEHIKLNSIYAIGIANLKEIMNLNILQVCIAIYERVIKKLSVKPKLILIDGNLPKRE